MHAGYSLARPGCIDKARGFVILFTLYWKCRNLRSWLSWSASTRGRFGGVIGLPLFIEQADFE